MNPSDFDANMANSNIYNRLASSSPEDIMNSPDLSKLEGQGGLQSQTSSIPASINSAKQAFKSFSRPMSTLALNELLKQLDPTGDKMQNKINEKMKSSKDIAQSVGNTAQTIGTLLKNFSQ